MSSLAKYALYVIPPTSFCLGVWQVKRLKWKEALIEDLSAKLQAEPVDLLALEDWDDVEYKRVRVLGHFDPNPKNQLYLKPRPLIVNDEALLRGRSGLAPNVGVNVITRFHVHNTDLRILVNRGWLALKGRDGYEQSGQLGLQRPDGEGPLELVGLLRKSDRRPTYGLRNDAKSNEWHLRDVQAMAKAMNAAPIFLEADSSLSKLQPGGPIAGQIQLTVRNDHFNYSVFWFSLSALCTLLLLSLRSPKRGAASLWRPGDTREPAKAKVNR